MYSQIKHLVIIISILAENHKQKYYHQKKNMTKEKSAHLQFHVTIPFEHI